MLPYSDVMYTIKVMDLYFFLNAFLSISSIENQDIGEEIPFLLVNGATVEKAAPLSVAQ